MLQGLRIAMYHVDDLDGAKEWYTKVLGKAPYFDQPFYVGFNVGGFELGLNPSTDRVTKGGSTYTYWGVKDARSEFQRLQSLGAKAHGEVQDVGEGILVATVTDPWDNIFGIVQNPNFKLEETAA
ncbi:MAG TPA: VOC family protein [Candidatus Angelobacter sp.]|nr:VOC family protein [Candidatus Angelobacter sp.]